MDLKVLQLESWMIYVIDTNDYKNICVGPIKPILNRDGYYYDRRRDKCWFEYKGLAYSYDKECFKYDLKLLNHVPLTEKQAQAIITLMSVKGVVNKKLRELLWTDRSWKDVRSTYRETVMYMNRLSKLDNNESLT